MPAETEHQFTEQDLRALGLKLRQLKQTLSPGEQDALKWIVLWAAAPPREDVRGFGATYDGDGQTLTVPNDENWSDLMSGPTAQVQF